MKKQIEFSEVKFGKQEEEIKASEAQGYKVLNIPFPNLGLGESVKTIATGLQKGTGVSEKGTMYQLLFVITKEGYRVSVELEIFKKLKDKAPIEVKAVKKDGNITTFSVSLT